jgi:putative endonuclease
MYYVYVINCANKTLYVGFTADLKQRIKRHNAGKVISTKYRAPVKLIYYEGFCNKSDALAREKYLKSGYGRQQLKQILKNTL